MRVLHCIYDDPSNPWVAGGGALRVFELYRRLAGRVDATVATGRFPGARDETIDGVRYVRLGSAQPYWLSRLSFGAAATRLLSRGNYDVGVFDFSGYTPIRLPDGRPTAIVVHMLHGPASAGRWGRAGARGLQALERWMLRRTADVCVTSDWLARELSPLVAPGTRLHLVRSGVPDEFFEVERAERDHLLYYGRFDVYQKGLDVLLAAMSRLEAEGRMPKLRLLGRGRDADRLKAMVAERGLAASVSVEDRPSRARVLEAMAGALAQVHPSRFEGLPMAPAEGMAAGVPVIATDVGATTEVLENGQGGLLIVPGEASALAEAIAAMVADPARRAALSASARASAQRFRWDRVATDHLEFLRAAAARASAGAPPASFGTDGTQP